VGTVTPPLAGHDARIYELLAAGRTFDDVCEIGRHRRSWRPSDVHRVISQWMPARVPPKLREEPPPPPRRHRTPGPKKEPIKHGTAAGYFLHHRRQELPACDACCEARKEADRQRKQAAETCRQCATFDGLVRHWQAQVYRAARKAAQNETKAAVEQVRVAGEHLAGVQTERARHLASHPADRERKRSA
jgi:hypothetical protein